MAALRALKFAKYLPELGWEPVVFHAGPGSMYLQDPALLDERPAGVRRVPVRTFDFVVELVGGVLAAEVRRGNPGRTYLGNL